MLNTPTESVTRGQAGHGINRFSTILILDFLRELFIKYCVGFKVNEAMFTACVKRV